MAELTIVDVLSARAGNRQLQDLAQWAKPIRERHFQDVLKGSLRLAEQEDPNEDAQSRADRSGAWHRPCPNATPGTVPGLSLVFGVATAVEADDRPTRARPVPGRVVAASATSIP